MSGVQEALEALAREVHAAWRDGMLAQGRDVAPHRMTWETLSPEDHALDAYIADRLAAALASTPAPAGAGAGGSTPGPWGVERTDNHNWVGPMRPGGQKVASVVVSLERGTGLTPAASNRSDADAALIAAAPTLAAGWPNDGLRIPWVLAGEVAVILRHHQADMRVNRETGQRTDTVNRFCDEYVALYEALRTALEPRA